MKTKAISLRPFIGTKAYDVSRAFYRDLGFEEFVIDAKMSVFKNDTLAFYLQDYYAKEWIENTMLFMEVEDVEACYKELEALNLPQKYAGVRLSPIRHEYWGSECFLHDPAGILWHFGQFKG